MLRVWNNSVDLMGSKSRRDGLTVARYCYDAAFLNARLYMSLDFERRANFNK